MLTVLTQHALENEEDQLEEGVEEEEEDEEAASMDTIHVSFLLQYLHTYIRYLLISSIDKPEQISSGLFSLVFVLS